MAEQRIRPLPFELVSEAWKGVDNTILAAQQWLLFYTQSAVSEHTGRAKHLRRRNDMKIGSLFSGYGGLDIAAEHHFGAKTVWHAEFEDAPSKVLAHHWPGIPNLHDVSLVDWSAVEPVDIITGGFPCQDVSLAGRRAGMTEGTRSNLWGAMRTAIETIRPQYAVIENVRGLLSATAQSDSDLEQRPGFMGDEPNVTLRALGRVLGDLADIGYDAQWHGLRAADIGAPHGRYRVFILATDTRSRSSRQRVTAPRQETSRGPSGESGGRSRTQAPAYSPDIRRWESQQRQVSPERFESADSRQSQPGGSRDSQQHSPRPARGSAKAPSNTGSATFGQYPGRSPEEEAWTRGSDRLSDPHGEQLATNWGPYEPAIRRWERSLGRVAPAPTELSARGRPQLSPVFVEWMMGLNAGHVTGIEGISRAQQLNMLGNGVVPQQALAALQSMTGRMAHGKAT